MFRTVFPSIIRSSRLYTQHQAYIIQGTCMTYTWCCVYSLELLMMDGKPVWYLPDGVCTVLNSWWRTERPSEIYRLIFSKLENCASSWFYYRNSPSLLLSNSNHVCSVYRGFGFHLSSLRPPFLLQVGLSPTLVIHRLIRIRWARLQDVIA